MLEKVYNGFLIRFLKLTSDLGYGLPFSSHLILLHCLITRILFSKIFEKIIYKRLYHHLTSNNILVNEQFGFRCNSSTKIAIYALINNILSSLNNRIIVSGLFCDLQKAFDCTNYDILLSK
jgi:hypothetical protein